MISDHLAAIETKISAELARRPECFIVHPTEARALGALDADELSAFAIEHGWRVVRRLGGRQFQFYNDTTARLLKEET